MHLASTIGGCRFQERRPSSSLRRCAAARLGGGFGRPRSVELMVFIDRRFSRELPIQPDFVGRSVDSIDGQHVTVEWKESDGVDRVSLNQVER